MNNMKNIIERIIYSEMFKDYKKKQQEYRRLKKIKDAKQKQSN